MEFTRHFPQRMLLKKNWRGRITRRSRSTHVFELTCKMDAASIYLQNHHVPELIDRLILKLIEGQPPNEKQFLRDQLYFITEQRFDESKALSEDPLALLPPIYAAPRSSGSNKDKNAVAGNPILLTKCMTPDMYLRHRQVRSNSGVSVDDCIAGGVSFFQAPMLLESTSGAAPSPLQDTGTSVIGFMPGDADSFVVFSEIIDAIVAARNKGPLLGIGGKAFVPPQSDLMNAAKITSGFQFDERFVLGASVAVRRNVGSFRMTHCTTRSERRCLQRLFARACDSAFGSSSLTKGAFVDAAAQSKLSREKPLLRDLRLLATPSPQPWSTRSNVEWPDARGTYISDDYVFFANLFSGDEHIEVGCRAVRSSDVREAFEKVGQALQALGTALTDEDASLEWQRHPRFGFLFADLDRMYGCGVSVTFVVKLPLLSGHPALEQHLNRSKLTRVASTNGGSGDTMILSNVYVNEKPFSQMEADVVQTTCAGVLKLIELEELLRNGRQI